MPLCGSVSVAEQSLRLVMRLKEKDRFPRGCRSSDGFGRSLYEFSGSHGEENHLLFPTLLHGQTWRSEPPTNPSLPTTFLHVLRAFWAGVFEQFRGSGKKSRRLMIEAQIPKSVQFLKQWPVS